MLNVAIKVGKVVLPLAAGIAIHFGWNKFQTKKAKQKKSDQKS